MADSELNVVFRTTGADSAAKDADKVGRALDSAASSAKRLGNTSTGGKTMGRDLQSAAAGGSAASAQLDKTAGSANRSAQATDNASRAQKNYFEHIARTTVQSALINKAFLSMVDGIGDAVKQVDLLENFPAVMATMGVSSKDSAESLQKLRSYTQSVGEDLNSAATSVQRFVATNGDIKASTALYAGITNALKAGTNDAEKHANALEQITQAYNRGSFEMAEWKTIMQAMPAQVNMVAQSLGYVNAGALRQAMVDGKVSVADFLAELTKLGTNSGPIAEQAMRNMSGIQFAAAALRATLSNTITEIIAAIGRQNIVNALQFISQVVIALGQGVIWLINIFRSLFGLLTGQKLEPISGDAAGNIAAANKGVGGLKDGLDDADDSAKKLRQQLAAFDKMNVLTEDAGAGKKKKKKKGVGGGDFNAGQLKNLGDIFGDMSVGLQKVSIWAKIVAGIIGSLLAYRALKFLWTLGGDFIGKIKSALKFLGLIKPTSEEAAKGLKTLPGIFNSIGSGLGSAMSWLKANPYVLVAAAIALVVAGLVHLYNTNEEFKKGVDEVWKPILDVLKEVAKFLTAVFLASLKELKTYWDNTMKALGETLKPVIKALEPVIKKIKEFIKYIAEAAKKVLGAKTGMEALGKIVGGVFFVAIVAAVAPLAILAAALAAIVVVIGIVIIAIMNVVRIITEAAIAIWNGISAAFSSVVGFFSSLFQSAWNAIVAAWDGAGAFFAAVWGGIVAVFSAVGAWFSDRFKEAWNGIVATWSGVTNWFQLLWTGIVYIFSSVGTWFKDRFNDAWNGIVNTWNGAGTWFQNTWNGIVNVFSNVGGWFGDRFRDAWNNIVGIFSGLGGFFRWVWNGIVGVFWNIGTAVGDAIGGAFKNVVNTVINFAESMINGFIRGINGAIGAINHIPGVHIRGLGEIHVPRLARGGVVDNPTIAQIGEAGTEAVVPLENNTEWINKIASKLNNANTQATPGDSMPVTNDRTKSPAVININLSGVLATSDQEKRKLAEMLAKELNKTMKARGMA